MRMSQILPHPRYGDVGDGLTRAHELLIKCGYIVHIAPGVHIMAPLGFRVLRKIEDIIFKTMETFGVANLSLPIIQPRALWEKTGRWNTYQADGVLFTTHERHGKADYALAPTAEEVVTLLASQVIESYRDLPVTFHQIGPKFRDELHPRGGLLRGREFGMSDAYSFDRDEAGMRRSYELFRIIYDAIFRACGIKSFKSVQADAGAIGGQGSAEFMVPTEDGGENVLITCSTCNYGANVEKAGSTIPRATELEDVKISMHVEHTPNTRTVEELCRLFPGLNATRMIKTIIFSVDSVLGTDKSYAVAVCIRGDLEVNLVKLKNVLNAQSVVPAEADVVMQVTNADVGFAGPIDLQGVRILYDHSVEGLTNVLCGINRTDYHALDVTPGRDFPSPTTYHDLHRAAVGHRCPACGNGTLLESRGIEIGHIFMLEAKKYAETLEATFTDEDGGQKPCWMGCYGIGTTRLVQAIADQNNDENGLVWPLPVAPFAAHIVPVMWSDRVQRGLAEKIHEMIGTAGIEVLLDDRDLRVGVKFKDADYIGCPWRINVGRRAHENVVELRERATGRTEDIGADELLSRLAVVLQQ